MSETHHREPVNLAPGDWALWLGEDGKGAATLMRPAPEGRYARWRVDPRVNSNRAEGPDLVEPLAA
jgi:putative SOS response-associated peptidase YedK